MTASPADADGSIRPPPAEEAVRELGAWLVDQTIHGAAIDRLLEGFCERLNALGVPLLRGHLSFGWLHPMVGSISITWSRDAGLTRDRHPRGEVTEEWLASPPKALMDSGGDFARYRLEEGEGVERFEHLADLEAQGASDYVLTLTAFRDRKAALETRDGLIASWSCDAPGGFTDAEIAVLKRLMPRLALGVKAAVREEAARNVLSAYLGASAGQRVLDGKIRLGDGDEISAVLWFSDMRGSTALADAMAPSDFLALLNRYFDCTAGAVLDHGGEVLRFVGDAVLAIFPTDGPGGGERAGRLAMAAAEEAFARARRLNEAREPDAPEIAFGLALHVGDVLYGNIGVPERVEFSVIGAAANEVARLEQLTKEEGRPVIASDAFHALAPPREGWENLGPRHFRGVRRPQTVWGRGA
ncbi:MAG: adenylate/guanylate cyclase domain-containing protein [Marivibrio sp.]|uniref:adenylate/guanylate cyclase domain-containing protein n=1 Tax=Marivibrio sp. TaxID=2039719 RepID=UPI0032F05970